MYLDPSRFDCELIAKQSVWNFQFFSPLSPSLDEVRKFGGISACSLHHSVQNCNFFCLLLLYVYVAAVEGILQDFAILWRSFLERLKIAN